MGGEQICPHAKISKSNTCEIRLSKMQGNVRFFGVDNHYKTH